MPPVNKHKYPPPTGSCAGGRLSEWELGKPVQSPVILLSHESVIYKAASSDVEGNGKPPHYYFFPGQIIMAETNITMALSPRQTLNGQRVRRISGSAIKIATWNVRSLYEDGKLENVIQEMSRLELDILGISELRWIGNGKLTSGDATVYYSGSNDSQHHRNGVAVLIKAALHVRNFLPISDRVMLLQLEAKPFNINIVQVYAPTADKNDDLIEAFYGDIDTALKITKTHELTIITGDFNSKIGQGSVPEVVGSFGLGVRNDRGERLVQYCQENDLVVANTFFKLPPRRLYTWRSPADRSEKIVRNQIDFLLINKRHRNSIKSAKTYPGADIGSDHNPVVAEIKVRLKKISRQPNTAKINLDNLSNPDLKKQLHLAVNNEMCRLKQENDNPNCSDTQQAWCDLKTSILHTGMNILVPTPRYKKTKWITQEILDLMDERRINKVNKEKYDALQLSIRNKIRLAKETWYGDLCSEIEELDKKFDYFNMHKKINEVISHKHQGRLQTTLLNKDGSYASCTDDMLVTWEQYVKELFHDSRSDPVEFVCKDLGPAITRRELYHAIRKSKTRKAVGPDDIPVDIIKEIEECNLDYLVNLFNAIYDSGMIPSDWLKSTFITLPKIKNPQKCSDYRTISLMSHVLKLFLKVIHNRIYSKCESLISFTQFGFRSGLGTRDALFGYQVLVQRCWDMNRDLFVCFIDYEKAFDRVQHVKLMEVLHKSGLDRKDCCFIKNLYWQQHANIRVNGKLSSYIEIERGVRQGCILSPLLFNLYAEAIFSEALDGSLDGVLINGKLLNNIRYADDTLLIADSLEGLQSLVNLVASVSAEYGININTKKTKYMVVSRTPELFTYLCLNGHSLERVSKFRYLGTMVDEKGDHSLEIRCRIEQARNAFSRMKRVLCDRNLSITLRTRIARCYVFSVLLYGVEAWTLTEAMSKKLEAFEMWVYRRMLKISWTDRVRNSTVLQRMRKTLEVLITIKERKLQYFGHIMRNARKYELLQLIIQGKVEGRRRPGRRRISWLKNLRQWFGKSTRSLFRAAVSKVEIAIMIANLRKETAR